MRNTIFAAVAAGTLFATPALARDFNLWTCTARPTHGFWFGTGPSYEGYSRLFEAGSGAGQQARVRAFENAIRNCKWSTDRDCNARIEDCNVQRFQSRF